MVKRESFDNISTKSPLKIAIITCENRNDDYILLHDENLKEYCKKYNYEYLRCYNEEVFGEIPVYWYKIAYINSIIHNYDFVMWIDSDTLITDKNIRLEDVINLNKDKDIYIGTDYNTDTYNAGIFIIKNSSIGREFLKECLKKLDDKTCIDGKKILGSWAGPCYEQGYMNILLKSKYKDNTEIISSSFFKNSEFVTPEKSFITHIYGPQSDILLPIIYKELQ